MDFEQSHKALRHWVTKSTKSNKLEGNALTIEQRIQNLLNVTPPITSEIIVYRGHNPRSRVIYQDSWFSTSSDVTKVRNQHISDGTTCCLFKLHLLPGIKTIYVDDTIKNAGLAKTKFNESEIIVNGGGYFYIDESLTREGFRQIEDYDGITQYEAWYSTKVPVRGPRLNTANILKKINAIPEEEFEMIDTVDELIRDGYIFYLNVHEDNEKNIQAHINSKKSKSGGRRKTRKLYRKSRKSRKARTKLLYH
jgi:hypothetical protein